METELKINASLNNLFGFGVSPAKIQRSESQTVELPQPKTTKPTLYLQDFMIKNAANIATIKVELHQKYGIKISYDNDVVIFSSSFSAKKNMMHVFHQEANGLILDAKTFSPLVVPPRSLKMNHSQELVNKFINLGYYRIYKALDGTTINLYYFKGEWRISTTRGFSMAGVIWNGIKTYKQVLEDILKKKNLTWDTFTSLLDTNCCYTFGIKHQEYHKFPNYDYSMWYIQSVNLNPSAETYLYSRISNPLTKYIPSQPKYMSIVKNIRELYLLAKNALGTYQRTGEVCYGFIIRSNDPNITEFESDLLIESSLMQFIRLNWYNNKTVKAAKTYGFDKENLICLKAVIDHKASSLFGQIFPTYKPQIDKIINKLDKLIDFCLKKINAESYICEEKTQFVVNAILELFQKKVEINWKRCSQDERKTYISQFILSAEMMEILYRYLFA